MSLLSSILLGLIQGMAEFLPISSSGHLAIAEHLLNVRASRRSLTFSMSCRTWAPWWRCLAYWSDIRDMILS